MITINTNSLLDGLFELFLLVLPFLVLLIIWWIYWCLSSGKRREFLNKF